MEGDCYLNALPGEPKFTLLARDPQSPDRVREWANQREKEIRAGLRPETDWEQVAKARQIAWDMLQWRIANDGAWRQPDLLRNSQGPDERLPVDRTSPVAVNAGSCLGRRQGDEYWCRACGLRWAADDLDPPPCPERLQR